ncbi:MAG: BlaI/MecI/CopY family transcriptional regulator [Lachnospiraceae bacterium]|nr:BlaI/MecI/CopY family transcriptional regulator [Lachnospiraceae bacterium]
MKLSDGEWKIMQLLWKKSPKTIIQLTKDLESETGWTKHTVISYLKRMEEKGAVRYQTEGRAKAFYPAIEERDAELQETRYFLDKVFQGKLGLLLHTMVQQHNFSDDEIEELQSILDQAKRGS